MKCPTCGHESEESEESEEITNIECDFTTSEFSKFTLDGSINDDRENIWEFIFGEDWDNVGGGSREKLNGNTFSWVMDGVDFDAFEEIAEELEKLHGDNLKVNLDLRGYDRNHILVDNFGL